MPFFQINDNPVLRGMTIFYESQVSAEALISFHALCDCKVKAEMYDPVTQHLDANSTTVY
jgi:hypothetical protein